MLMPKFLDKNAPSVVIIFSDIDAQVMLVWD